MDKKTLREESPWIACVSKANYRNFKKVFQESEVYRKNKKIVIFGAGIMGLQFSYFLREFGIDELLFCDNDKEKNGREIGGIKVILPSELENKKDEYFIFLVMECYEACAEQLINMGYLEGTMWQKVSNFSEQKLYDSFLKDENAQVLILGDCAVTTVSLFEDDKESLEELLYQSNRTKIMALNSMYMRAYYNLLLYNMDKMRELNTVIVLLDLGIFQDKYPLLQKNQHAAIMEQIKKTSGIIDDEAELFIEAAKIRETGGQIFEHCSPNRKENISGERLEQERKIHMRLNNLYRLKEDSESIDYLDMFGEICTKKGLHMIGVILPVNYEQGVKYFGNKFYELYEAIRDVIISHIEMSHGHVIDASYLLKESEFISVRSSNEGMNSLGRRKLAELIENNL